MFHSSFRHYRFETRCQNQCLPLWFHIVRRLYNVVGDIQRKTHHRRPSINLMGTEGIAIGLDIPKGNHVLLPGYNHLVGCLRANSPHIPLTQLVS